MLAAIAIHRVSTIDVLPTNVADTRTKSHCNRNGYRPDTLGGGIGLPRLLFGVMGTRDGG